VKEQLADTENGERSQDARSRGTKKGPQGRPKNNTRRKIKIKSWGVPGRLQGVETGWGEEKKHSGKEGANFA